jgi:hypothetical protein
MNVMVTKKSVSQRSGPGTRDGEMRKALQHGLYSSPCRVVVTCQIIRGNIWSRGFCFDIVEYNRTNNKRQLRFEIVNNGRESSRPMYN